MTKRRTFAPPKPNESRGELPADRTMQQKAAKHDVYSSQVSKWTHKASDGLVQLFEQAASCCVQVAGVSCRRQQ